MGGLAAMATDGSISESPQFPRCPRCGLFLIVGFVTGPFLSDLKAKHGWTIGRFDRDSPRDRWDAAVTGCVVHRCPRCGT